ncbi:swr1 complex component [Ptychographa xylographoides]|nr:swr1 complex component [Ptychographa xylographoides]
MQNGLDNNLHAAWSKTADLATPTTNSHFEVRIPLLRDYQSQPTSSNEESHGEHHNDRRPKKRRKLGDDFDTPQHSVSRPVSPPWKKIAVEGPTSFVEGGRRKSSRTNAVPLELQPLSDKRRTRATIRQSSSTIDIRHGVRSVQKPSPLTPSSSRSQANGISHKLNKITSSIASKSPAKFQSEGGSTKLYDVSPGSSVQRSYKKKQAAVPQASPSPQPTRKSLYKTRRTARFSNKSNTRLSRQDETAKGWHKEELALEAAIEYEKADAVEAEDDHDECDEEEDDDDDDDDEMDVDTPLDPNFRFQKLNFKVHIPTITIQHPAHVVQPRKFISLKEWLEHDDPLAGSEAHRLNDREAVREARIRLRVLDAATLQGPLSVERCSVYIPVPQEEPQLQYGHSDHLAAHAVYFRKLMNKEHHNHSTTAKKIAFAVKQKWRRNIPRKVAKDNNKVWNEVPRVIRRQCVADLDRKWEMFRAEVKLHQLKQWEEEQDALGKEALDKVLEKSARLLDKRRRGSSLSASTAIDDDSSSSRGSGEASGSEDANSRADSEDEQNMSSSQSESEAGSRENLANEDDGLTIDQIRLKYADQPTESLDHPSDGIFTIIKKDLLPEKDSTTLGFSKASGSMPRSGDDKDSISIVNYASEMDQRMLDESDESTDMDSGTGESDDDSKNDEDGESEDESCDNEHGLGLLGFFARTDIDEQVYPITPTDGETAMTEDVEEVSLIPDAAQVQTPSASNSEASSIDVQKDIKQPVEEKQSCLSARAFDEMEDVVNPGNALATVRLSRLEELPKLDQIGDNESESLPATPVSSKPMKTQVPSLLRGTLREYQHFGLEWLAGLYANGTNGILADEMGLGKTIQTISLLAHLAVEHENWGPHLIVVPTSVMLNWEMEFKKFLPGFKILTYYGTQEERKQKRKGWLDDDKWNVCITSYQLVLQDQQTFKRRAWQYLVLDEAHNIKNFRSQRWQTLLTFRTQARLLLTGTPLQNNLTELWSLLFFLMPSDSNETGIAGFAGLQDFTSWFKKPVDQILEQGRETMDDEAKELVHRLHGVLRPFLLRRLKADVEKQMPGKFEHVVYCKLSKRQRYLYDGFMSRTQTRETLANGNYLSIINCLMQLRKVCNHPDLFETRQIVTSFAMPKSAVADFEIKELLVRRRLLQDDGMQAIDLDVVNLLPGANGPISALDTIQNSRLGALGRLRQLVNQQFGRILPNMQFDGSSMETTLAYMENKARSSTLEELRHCAYLTSLRSQRRPLYSFGLMERVRIKTLKQLPMSPMPKGRAQLAEWYSNISPLMQEMVLDLPRRSQAMQVTIQKFACVTPAVVAPEMNRLALSSRGIEVVQEAKQLCPQDPFHEARMRLSIAFPDKRLLQYDCGKLQRLDTLLRTLQTGGHRALIFTQMTKVLDILEQFLSIHGHRYLRLDGATKVEQRQTLTDRFNNDKRILAFILSSRSGGLGINLTGADTVIFYDLDWNPAMDKQCQDRAHRIGQTRDVHIYRFVSEHTIEANILRKANQKRLLDDVVIQAGDFTTDYFNKPEAKDIVDEELLGERDAEASAAMDRVLGGPGSGKVSGRIFEQAEDKEDVTAAKEAEKEEAQADQVDFDEKTMNGGPGTPKTPGSGAFTPKPFGAKVGPLSTAPGQHKAVVDAVFIDDETLHSADVLPTTTMSADIFTEREGIGVDHYMVKFLERELKDIPVVPPIDKAKAKVKKGGEHKVWKLK